MIKVLRHGNRTSTQNPANPTQYTGVITVVFIEEGRPGANEDLARGSDLLSQAVGVPSGLPQVRTHSHPVLATAIGEYPVGKEFPGLFINRKLYSNPQMRQQAEVDARMINGQPTYFVTVIDNKQLPDEDNRLDKNTMARLAPHHFQSARAGAALVNVLEESTTPRVSHGVATLLGEPVVGTHN